MRWSAIIQGLRAILIVFTCVLYAEEPWSVSRQHPVTAELRRPIRQTQKIEIPSSLSHLLFEFYSRYISPIDGQSCHYLPTCSAYGVEALEKYGIWRGLLMTTDRLIRCHPGQQEHPIDPPVWY